MKYKVSRKIFKKYLSKIPLSKINNLIALIYSSLDSSEISEENFFK